MLSEERGLLPGHQWGPRTGHQWILFHGHGHDARAFFAKALHTLDASLPPDRSEELRRAEADLAHLKVNNRHATGREALAERRLREAASRRIGTRNKTEMTLARAELIFGRGDVERTTAAVSNATTVVATERQAVSNRAAAEARTSDERAALRQAVRTVDEALTTTRPDRVPAILNAHIGSRLGELLGTPPEDAKGQAAWCGIAYRMETALDATHLDHIRNAAGLSWSKDPLDRLTNELLDSDPRAIAHAQAIIASKPPIVVGHGIDVSNPLLWERAARVGWERAVQTDQSVRSDIAVELGF